MGGERLLDDRGQLAGAYEWRDVRTLSSWAIMSTAIVRTASSRPWINPLAPGGGRCDDEPPRLNTQARQEHMAHVVTFRSSKFEIATETPNPINPIAGESVLRWLCEQLRNSPYQTTTPEAEDWGWYVDARGAGASYLVGASADADERGASIDWTVQIHKHRSLIDRFTGANKMAADDPLSVLIERIIRSDPAIADVERQTWSRIRMAIVDADVHADSARASSRAIEVLPTRLASDPSIPTIRLRLPHRRLPLIRAQRPAHIHSSP